MYDALIDARALARHLRDPDWVVLDCRFSLADPEAGERAYAAGHVPGARYAHLERVLSGPIEPGVTGRHPLPDPTALAERFGAWGIGDGVQVAAYDDAGGAIAARAWWLLGWLGHDAVAVLDGGLSAWVEAGLPLDDGPPAERLRRRFVVRLRDERVATADEVAAAAIGTGCVLDARGADRFRGEHETIDPIAGRIPGARSAPFAANLGPDGRFLPPAVLRAHYLAATGGSAVASDAADPPIVYCGSGVTAAHDVLAMRVAGLPEPRLYAGSWSHWITDPRRPVATGPA